MDEVENRHEGKPLPHLRPELYKDMPQYAQDILRLADNIYFLIHKQSVSSTPSSDTPASLNEALDKALNAY